MTRRKPLPTIVISDVHLGPGGSLTTFRDGASLVGILDRLAAESAVELVLAGDVFDFLQCQGYDGFDAESSADRFESIARNPQTATVLDALARFAGRPGNELTVLSGNHDPELLVPAVREALERRVGRRGTVRWADDEPIHAGLDGGPAVHGRALRIGDDLVWIVHGDRWDPHNAIDRKAVVRQVRGGRPVVLPVGSRLVYEVLSHIKPDCRWIDELKPEFPAVFLLLLYIDPARTWRHLERHWGLSFRLLMGVLQARLRDGPLFEPGATVAATPAEEDVGAWLAASLADEAQSLALTERAAVLAAAAERLQSLPPPGGTLASHDGFGRLMLRAWMNAARKQDRFQTIDAPDGVVASARRYLPEGLRALVAGHTHGMRCHVARSTAYVNTGTWLPVASIPQGDLREWVDRWEAGDHPESDAPRTLARIEAGGHGAAVSLWRIDGTGSPCEVERA